MRAATGWHPPALPVRRRPARRCRTGPSDAGRHRGRSRKSAASRRSADVRAPTSGRISKPVTRPEPASQTGLAPISASACAISSPPVRMLAVPQQVSTSDAATRPLPENTARPPARPIAGRDARLFLSARRAHRRNRSSPRRQARPAGPATAHRRAPAGRTAGSAVRTRPSPTVRNRSPTGGSASSISASTACAAGHSDGVHYIARDNLRRAVQAVQPYRHLSAMAHRRHVPEHPALLRSKVRAKSQSSGSNAEKPEILGNRPLQAVLPCLRRHAGPAPTQTADRSEPPSGLSPRYAGRRGSEVPSDRTDAHRAAPDGFPRPSRR
jgi:hypothetical protein